MKVKFIDEEIELDFTNMTNYISDDDKLILAYRETGKTNTGSNLYSVGTKLRNFIRRKNG